MGSGLVWRAREHKPITGAKPPARVQGAEPPVRGQGTKPPEADGILVLEHTFLRSPGACSGSDLTEATSVHLILLPF